MGLSQRSELGTGLNRPPFGIRIDRSAEDLVVFFFLFLSFSSLEWEVGLSRVCYQILSPISLGFDSGGNSLNPLLSLRKKVLAFASRP